MAAIPKQPFNPRNWYWIVAGSNAQVYSSAIGDYVPVADATYQAWLTSNTPTKIDSEASLGDVLDVYSLRPVAANVLDGYTSSQANRVDLVIGQILFNHENRIRTLAGQQAVTANQFKAFIKGLL